MKPLVAILFGLSVGTAAAQTPNDRRPAYVPYSCKSFAEKSAIAHAFLAEYEQARKFDTVPETEVNGRNNMAIAGTVALQKAETAVLSTINATEKDPTLRWPMLALWSELFAAIDEGRMAERDWYAAQSARSVCIIGGGPFALNDPMEIARQKDFEERNSHNCAHANAATGLQHEDRTASVTFHFMVFADRRFPPEDRERYRKMVETSGLPAGRQAMLMACFDHAGDRRWEPEDLYPNVPTKL